MAWVNFEKIVLKIADFQQILGVNQQIFQIFGKPNADFQAKKYGNTVGIGFGQIPPKDSDEISNQRLKNHGYLEQECYWQQEAASTFLV